MEVVPAGFDDNTSGIIKTVSALAITLRDERDAESSAAGRSLTVGIPVTQGWENVEITPTGDSWFIEEDYIPGPVQRVTSGPLGEFNVRPVYVIKVYGISNIGVQALYAVADGILQAFLPSHTMTLADGTIVRVLSDPGPYRGQVIEDSAPYITVTIPLWVRTRNQI